MHQPPVIPDKVLEANTCCLCERYLTVSPISVHPDGGNICGRCQKKANQSSPFLFESTIFDLIEISIPYAILAYTNHLFPCINRYEGCSKLLQFSEIKNHENTCRSTSLVCRYCNYVGTGSQQLHHFKKCHPKNVFEKVHFRFPAERRFGANLIKSADSLFFLDLRFGKKIVEFYVTPTSQNLDDGIDFFCLLKFVDGEVIDQTTLTRRTHRGIFHRIEIKRGDGVEEKDDLFCECLLRRVL